MKSCWFSCYRENIRSQNRKDKISCNKALKNIVKTYFNASMYALCMSTEYVQGGVARLKLNSRYCFYIFSPLFFPISLLVRVEVLESELESNLFVTSNSARNHQIPVLFH